MDFRIADTFTGSLARLTGEEQKAAKTSAFDLQLDPVNPGMQFHKLDRARDKSFWSVRVSRDIRLIVHKTATSLLLCYVDHHDAAYRWAEQRKIERHPTTGAAQLVEIRETVREIEVPRYIDTPAGSPPAATRPRLFADVSDQDLLGYGVPQEWLSDVREATEETLFDLAAHLPGEAAEALLELATGGTPQPAGPVGAMPPIDPFAHPDARRRFYLVATSEDLQRALDFPWEKWTVFLHPTQLDVVERKYNGPARVSGSAGTGKTVVAIHRAAHLARRDPQAKVLLTTFSEALARLLRVKLERLVGGEADLLERVVVTSLDAIGIDTFDVTHGPARIADASTLQTLIVDASRAVAGHRFSDRFLATEWRDVVDPWQLDTWEAYRDVARLGRKTRVGESQRAVLWSIFERVRSALAEQRLLTMSGVFACAASDVSNGGRRLFDCVVVDEAQDLSVAQLRFLAALAGNRADGLFFAGDLGQRIFQAPFSWRSLGVDVRGRSHTLRVNYRTSHQIRRQADRLLGVELADVDGNLEVRKGTISAFDGPEPTILIAPSRQAERIAIASWLEARVAEGIAPREIAVFVRSEAELERAREAVRDAGLEATDLEEATDAPRGVGVGTMHLAKGLEFRAVVVAACDDDIVPLQGRIADVSDEADLADVYETERHLLYVACTRARDNLLVTGVAPASEFLDDLETRR